MKVLVVDDERLARARIRRLLQRLPGSFECEEAANTLLATEALASFDPDVVLLDIHMPGGSGVPFARSLPASLGIVFVTADPSQAVEAFEVGAYDYLVKPVRLERLERALQRVDARRDRQAVRVVSRGPKGVRWFDARQIERFRAEDKVTVFELDGDEFVIDDSLDTLEAKLSHHRVDRSELVDLTAVVALEGNELVLTSGQRALVSRRRLASVRKALAGLAG